jgi:predicted dehydrogenase
VSAASPGVAILGCGLIGGKRAAALAPAHLVACADLDAARAEALAKKWPGVQAASVDEVLARTEVEIAVVATTNESLAPLAIAALAAGKHVLMEKPGGRTVAEIDAIRTAATRANRLVRVGFNHRYHPALQRARALVDEGALGPLMFLRGRYGHGGRVGYDREWRADPVRSGGGELIDQGVHVIDLARWFLGDFTAVDGFAATYFWDMPVDDNGFLLLRTARGQAASLHVSCTEWKNLFSLEIYGRTGKLSIDGLGGSYGVERLTYYRMLPEMGPPETTAWEYPRGDQSWMLEWTEFLEDIRLGREPSAGLDAARAALDVVGTIYARSGYNTGP